MLTALSFGLVATIAAQEPASPGEWIFNTTFGYCIAQQYLGSKGRAVRIIRTAAGEDTYIVLFDEVAWGNKPSAELENASVRLDPDGVFSGAGRAGPARSNASRFVSVMVSDPRLMEKLAAASTISVSHPKLGSMSTTFRASAAAVEALRGCEDKKMAEWGIDPVAWRALRSAPRPVSDFRSWIQPESRRLRDARRPEGQAVVRLTVESDGTIKDCRGIDPSVRKLNEVACIGIRRRGRFIPALDGQGRPIPSPYVIVAEFELAS